MKRRDFLKGVSILPTLALVKVEAKEDKVLYRIQPKESPLETMGKKAIVYPHSYTRYEGGDWNRWEPGRYVYLRNLRLFELYESRNNVYVRDNICGHFAHSIIFRDPNSPGSGRRWDCRNGWTTEYVFADWGKGEW